MKKVLLDVVVKQEYLMFCNSESSATDFRYVNGCLEHFARGNP